MPTVTAKRAQLKKRSLVYFDEKWRIDLLKMSRGNSTSVTGRSRLPRITIIGFN